MSYIQTSSLAQKEVGINEWFWELKTRKDFGELIEVVFANTEYIKHSLGFNPIIKGLGLMKSWYPTFLSMKYKINYFYYRSQVVTKFVGYARNNDIDQVLKCLRVGIDPNSRISSHSILPHKRSCTALIEASDRGNIGIVKVLLRAGAEPNICCDYGWSPLMVACQQCYDGIIKVLLRAGADPDFRREGKTVLMRAVHQQNHKIVNALLRAKADPNLSDNEGYTALMAAAAGGEVKIVKKLLEYNADPSAVNMHGRTALYITEIESRYEFAARRIYCKVIKILEEFQDVCTP